MKNGQESLTMEPVTTAGTVRVDNNGYIYLETWIDWCFIAISCFCFLLGIKIVLQGKKLLGFSRSYAISQIALGIVVVICSFFIKQAINFLFWGPPPPLFS